MKSKYAVILGNLGNTRDRFCDGYKDNLPAVEMLILENNGHELWKPDFDSYLDAIANFLTRIDAKSASTKS